MKLDVNNNEEHELYIKALKSLSQHGKISDHHKTPETMQEKDFMLASNKVVSKKSFCLNITPEKFYTIFKRNKTV